MSEEPTSTTGNNNEPLSPEREGNQEEQTAAPFNDDENTPAQADRPQEDSMRTQDENESSLTTQQSLTTAKSVRRRPRRAHEERQRKAAETLQRFFRLGLLKLRLTAVRKNACATLIQSQVRGRQARAKHKPALDEMTRQRSLQYVRDPMEEVPVPLRPHVGAAKIQLILRRHFARKNFTLIKEWMSTRTIQRFYRAHLWRMRSGQYSQRKLLKAKHHTMATKMQAAWRGYACRLWLDTSKEELGREQSDRFSKNEKMRRAMKIEQQARKENARIDREMQKEAERELLGMIFTTDDPNQDIVEWSTQQTYASDIKRKAAASRKLPPLAEVPMPLTAVVDEPYIPNVAVLEPSDEMQLIVERNTRGTPYNMANVKQKALTAAQRRIRQKYSTPHGHERETMKYVLGKKSP